ncbi:MAG TPA: DNA topoisomerase IV subunit B [Oligoflexia bacterium]|nr:DNA topoisomerase IV subunit B [Oligoflexia bacterium]HMP26800.1 DNA topoisomerase IV subunit B [Oligoflexia bacterium]
MNKKAVNKGNYTAEDIEVLEGLEPVRKRPGMYIGGTEGPAGLHHLIKEILDNSVDEAMNGHADKIILTLEKDGESVTIEDNGRGIPVDVHPRYKKPALQLLFTTLHSGGKFSDKNYLSAGGLHGVGASVVNALSEKLSVTVWRDGYEWRQDFSRGKPLSNLTKGAKSKQRGTKVYFKPDGEIFRSIRFDPKRIERMLEEKAFLNRALRISFRNLVSGEDKEFCFPEGIKTYLQQLLERDRQAPLGGEIFSLEKASGLKVEVVFAWTESTKDHILSFVNGIHTASGGTHEEAFKTGLAKALRNYLQVHDLIPKGLKITAEDLREGMFAIVSLNVPGSVAQLQFQGQTKDMLNNPEVAEPVETLAKSFENVLNAKTSVANALAQRIILSAKARVAARSAAEAVSRKVGVSHRLNLPGKLADCTSNRPENSELIIVEGESAGGNAKQGRDRETQAVLPLRGKVLNVIAAGETKIKENKEIADLISAIGAGYGVNFRPDKLRYHKIIILTDADADGMHIASLLLAFFYRHMRQLIEGGYLYIGLTPLYRIRIGSGAKEVTHWVYTDQQKEEIVSASKKAQLHITRFKGLGEMNHETLWQTSLNPRTRTISQVTARDLKNCDLMLDKIFGRDPSQRYDLIQEYSGRLDLDI